MHSPGDSASDYGTWRYVWSQSAKLLQVTEAPVETESTHPDTLVAQPIVFLPGTKPNELFGAIDHVAGTEKIFVHDAFGNVRSSRDSTGAAVETTGYTAYGLESGDTQEASGFAGGSNLYGYAHSNPVNFSDPFGLKAVCEPICTGIDVAFLIADVKDVRENGLSIGKGVGIGLGVISVLTPFVTALGAADDLARAASEYVDITRRSRGRARFWNRATDVSAGEFSENLVRAGYSRSVASDGVEVLVKGNRKYSIRSPELSRTAKRWTADVFIDGEQVGKIRLGGGR